MIRTLCFTSRIPKALYCSSSRFGTKALNKNWLSRDGVHDIHVSSVTAYPKAEDIPLPTNVEDINNIETARFSPERARDITGDVIGTLNAPHNTSKDNISSDDIESYDCTGAISLNSAMQTNVPDPYASKGKAPTHLNMPGGEWGRSDKYVSQDMQNSHYTNVKEGKGGLHEVNRLPDSKGTYSMLQALRRVGYHSQLRHFSSDANTPDNKDQTEVKNDKVSKLKKAVRDYGSTVIVFHVGISLISLGGFYLAVTSGIDFTRLLPSDMPSEVATEVGSFIVAYAIHKVFAPLRISITLFCTPFIVRYLRRVGILSTKKPPV